MLNVGNSMTITVATNGMIVDYYDHTEATQKKMIYTDTAEFKTWLDTMLPATEEETTAES